MTQHVERNRGCRVNLGGLVTAIERQERLKGVSINRAAPVFSHIGDENRKGGGNWKELEGTLDSREGSSQVFK